MKNNKLHLFIIAAITIMVLATTVLYGATTLLKGKINLGNIISLAVPLIVVVFMGFFISLRYRDIKQGMPLEDERSRKVKTNAASTSFYISLYWLLALSWLEPYIVKTFAVPRPDASAIVGAGIGGMAIIFLACWVYYDKKGKLI